MTDLKRSIVAAICGVVAAASASNIAVAEPLRLESGEVKAIDGGEVACTGIGADSRDDPRWKDYPLKLVFAEPNGDYLSNVTVRLVDARGAAVLDVLCSGPWVLAKLEAGAYQGTFSLDGTRARQSAVKVGETGQNRIVVNFPE